MMDNPQATEAKPADTNALDNQHNLATVSGSFYRYRRFSDPNSKEVIRNTERERIERMLAERIVWFAKPSTLNDPFDCKPVLAWSNNMGENRKRIEVMLKEVHFKRHGYNVKDKIAFSTRVTETMEHLKSQDRRNAIYWDVIDNHTGVLCLSKSWGIAQQWAYYAREHSGFCIELYVGESDPLPTHEIHYTKVRPEIDMIRLLGDVNYFRKAIVHPTLLTKARAWAHESEVRILHNSSGEVRLTDGIFRSITFGLATSAEDIVWTKAICKKAGLDIPFYQCVMDDKNFMLKRKKLFND